MSWSLAQRTAAGSLLLAVAVATGFGGLVLAIARATGESDAARRAETAIATADSLERLVIDIETGQRGFVITRDESFLQPALRADRELPAVEERLRRVTGDDAAQQARVAGITRAIGTYESGYSRTLIAAARTEPARAVRIVAAGRGKRLVDGIRTRFDRFSRAEESALAASRHRASGAAQRAYWAAGIAAGVVLLLVLAFAWLLRRLVLRPLRELGRSAQQLGRGDLTARVERSGDGEVGDLATAFNEMAESLHAERERIELLYRSAERIAAESDVEELALLALEQLAALTGAQLGALYAGEGDDLRLAAQRGIPEGAIHPFARADTATLGLPGESRLTLRQGDRTVGVLLFARSDGSELAADVLAAVESLADQVAVALSNDLAFREARRVAGINRIVLDSTRDGILMLDPEGRRVLVNASYERLMREFGVPPERPYEERIAAFAALTRDPERFALGQKELLTDPASEAVTEFTIRSSGRSFQHFSAPAHEGGRFVGRVYVLHEVTAEREADRLKSELLATVSHELRTPLAGILGFAELLQRPGLDDATRHAYVATVHREAVRLTGLINDFLDLQRIEEGALNLAFRPIHVRDVTVRQMELHERGSGLHRLELVAPDEPAEVLADEDRIAQVVGNLLSNAIKYSPAGGVVRVTVEVRPDSVLVAVEDEGLGIPADQQARIFEKFFRVDSSDTREIGGTGLGLALSREIVEAHGGRIGFESALGEGSTFWFELPTLGVGRDSRPLVLVVESEESPLVEYLETDGFRVLTADSGAEALRRVAVEPPALVCLDVGLPGPIDGWEFLARLKARTETATTPVVVCTGANSRRRASALGAADVLAKPFSRDELLAAVRRLLPLAHGRVLVVDDEATVRTLVADTLRGVGFDPVEAADGVEALAEVERVRPDAIVLDLMMPELDGFEVLERLRDDPEQRRIPVVVLTARDLSAAERSLLQSRAVSLLEKSAYSPDELRRLVRQALGR